MADPFTIGLGVVSAGSSIFGGLKAEDDAEEAAEEQMLLTRIQRDEEIRQRVRSASQQKGAAVAGVYGSNLQMSGSSRRYVEALDMENMREIAMAKSAARQEQRAIEKGAQGVGGALFAQGAADLLTAGLQAFSNRMAPKAGPQSLSPISTNRAGHASIAPRLTMAAGMR